MITTKKKLTHLRLTLEGQSVSKSAKVLKKQRAQTGSLLYHELIRRAKSKGKVSTIVELLDL